LDIRQESRKNNNQQKKKEKKESITLAFDKFVLDDIRKDATDAGVSVNSKINEIERLCSVPENYLKGTSFDNFSSSLCESHQIP
jgi:hypothetical protein